MREILEQLLAGRSLTEAEAARAFTLVLTGEANESQVGAMLALLARKGPSIEEIVGGARVMREHALRVLLNAPTDAPIRAALIDTCGTGGTPKTFNISTAAALVAAAARGRGLAPRGTNAPARVYVAKHGGRSRSGRGSAEVLVALGVNIDAPPIVQAQCLRHAGVCFSFAVQHHPAMRFAAGPRKSLGFPTIFNLIGPLTNPAGARRQLMGVYEPRYVPLIAEALARLGAERALVVHGCDGMDEITLAGPTACAEVRDGRVTRGTIEPTVLGLARATAESLTASSVEDGARIITRVLAGEPGPARDIVCLNAAAALMVGEVTADLSEGLALARAAIVSGEAARTLDRLREASNAPEAGG